MAIVVVVVVVVVVRSATPPVLQPSEHKRSYIIEIIQNVFKNFISKSNHFRVGSAIPIPLERGSVLVVHECVRVIVEEEQAPGLVVYSTVACNRTTVKDPSLSFRDCFYWCPGLHIGLLQLLCLKMNVPEIALMADDMFLGCGAHTYTHKK